MDSYLGQDTQVTYVHYKHPDKRIIKPAEAASLHEMSAEDPTGAAAQFLINAAAEGWTIDFPRRNGLAPDYDDAVGRALVNSTREDSATKAYAALVASSLGIDLIGDGR